MYLITLYFSAIAGLISFGLFILSYTFQFSPLYFFLTKFVILSTGTIFIATLLSLWLYGKDRTNAFLANLILLAITLFIVLFISENVVRYIFNDITTTGDNSSYFARKWKKKHIRLNSLGFRENEFRFQKPEGRYRVMFIGDSFTFGQGIKEENRFSNLIGQYLKNKGNYQVLNFGKPGAETANHIETLKEIVLPAKPDFVILQWYVNDFEGKNKSGRPKSMPLLPSKFLSSRLHKHSALYYLVNDRWKSLQLALGLHESYVEYMNRRFKDPSSADSVHALSEISEFIHKCKGNNIGLAIIIFPDFSYSQQFTYLRQRIIDKCDIEEITCIDLGPIFDKYPDQVQLWVNKFDRHPGTIANKLAADRIRESFAQIWLSQKER